MSKYEGHTPEPWTSRQFYQSDDEIIRIRQAGLQPTPALLNGGERVVMAGDCRICCVDIQSRVKRGMGHLAECAERDANAHLIAAAPTLLRQRDALLAAAKAVLARWTFDDRQQHTHTWHDMADCAELLRTAIADCERNEQ